MAWNLGPSVTWGEIANLRRNRLEGMLYLAHRRMPVVFHLTGNGGPALAGRHLRFVPRQPRRAHWPRRQPLIASQQIGVVARAQYRLEGVDATGRQPSQLRLEWFGQNGLMRMVLDDPQLEFLEALPEDDWWTRDAEDLLVGELPEWSVEDDVWHLHGGCDEGDGCCADDDDDDDADDAPAKQTFERGEQEDEALRRDEFEALSPLAEVLRPPLALLPVELLDERQVNRALQRSLARLARHGISLYVCPHLSPRDLYRVLAERLLPHAQVAPQLLRRGWIDYFSTFDVCPRCRELWAGRLNDDEFPP